MRFPEGQIRVLTFLAVRPQSKYLMSPGLSFFVCKMGNNKRIVMVIETMRHLKAQSRVLHICMLSEHSGLVFQVAKLEQNWLLYQKSTWNFEMYQPQLKG